MHSIEIASSLNNITEVESLIDQVCEDLSLNEDYYGNILIAVTEAVNNAIVHGNGSDESKKVSVNVDKEGTKLTFAISDVGAGFDFENLPDPTDPKNIEKPTGRGVFLMRNLADEVVFHDEGRVVELKFQIIAN